MLNFLSCFSLSHPRQILNEDFAVITQSYPLTLLTIHVPVSNVAQECDAFLGVIVKLQKVTISCVMSLPIYMEQLGPPSL
jgi:hypothetical protein